MRIASSRSWSGDSVGPRLGLAGCRVVVMLMGWAGRPLAGSDHDELAHHPVVLMLQQVAVEHVRHSRVAVAGELDQQSHGAARWDEHGVLPAGQGRRGPSAGLLADLELD